MDKFSLPALLSFRGKTGRLQFALAGLILFAIKYNLDRFIALNFGRTWFINDYFVQADHLAVNELAPEDRRFYLTLIIISIPFIWMGTALCLKRLRDAALPS